MDFTKLELTSQVSDIKLCNIKPPTEKPSCIFTVSGDRVCQTQNNANYIDGYSLILGHTQTCVKPS